MYEALPPCRALDLTESLGVRPVPMHSGHMESDSRLYLRRAAAPCDLLM